MLLQLVLLVIGLVLFYEMYWKRRHLPPGPTPLPLLGNMLSISMNYPGFSSYDAWMKQYGPIYTYWFGPMPIVTVNDARLVHEMFVVDGENYVDRAPFLDFSKEYRGGNFGIIESSGREWREQRRFTLHTLRDFGLGKEEMQERILIECEWLLSALEQESKKGSTKPNRYLERTVGSVINIVLFGYRFDENTEHEFHRLRDSLDAQNRLLSNPLSFVFFSSKFLRDNIPYLKRRYDVMMGVRDSLFQFFNDKIDAHKEVIDFDSSESADFCEAYLREIHKRKDEEDTPFNHTQFVNVCLDLWVAGMDTTASTMSWGVLLLIHHPEVLAKMHEEIDREVASDRLITMQDKTNLVYCQAVINEVQRYANIVPQNLTRRAARDVVVNGVKICAGTTVSPQISMLMRDPEVFPNPDTFDPERFVDDKGQLKNFKQFVPFSVGKRQCPGEGLARMELFVFFSNLVNRFDIEAVDKRNPPAITKVFSNVGKPMEYECVIKRRERHG